MKIKKTEIVIIGIVLLSLVIGICFYPLMPERMATHWNEKGQVDGYASRFWGLLFMPIVISVIAVVLMTIPKIDPLRSNIEKFRKYYDGFVIYTAVFMLSIHFHVILWNLGVQISIRAFLPIGIGLLLFYSGIVCENAKRNWTIGIRNAWTLSSEEVWEKTHKLGGKLFKIAGLICLFGFFFPNYWLFFTLGPVVSAALCAVVYSYFEYRRQQKSDDVEE